MRGTSGHGEQLYAKELLAAKLDLYPAEEGNRRVLAVLTHLNA